MSALLLVVLIIVAAAIVVGVMILLRRRKDTGEYTDDERAMLAAKTFDQYVLKRVRKHATMSTMYQAVDSETKKAVAVRVLHPEFCGDQEHVKSFLRRGEILEFLNKEHADLPIVRMLKYGQSKFGRYNRPFIAVEFFEGYDLGELLDDRKILTVAEATSIVTQIARSLTVVLREKVWHHQMALQAIMVRYPQPGRPEVKMVDFDIYKQDQIIASAMTGGADSKLIFMSPEQFENKIVDERSDIYSLGVMYYTLLCGRPPFVGGDYGEMARLHIGSPPPPLIDSVPIPVRDVVMKMLSKYAGDRYRSMDEVTRALEALRPDSSWSILPDVSSVPPLLPRAEEAKGEVRAGRGREPAKEPRADRVRPEPRPTGVLSLIFVELPMMLVSFVGRMISKVVSKVSVPRIAIVVLLAIVGLAVYLLTRSNLVSGDVTINVRDSGGKPVPEADVVLDPIVDPSGGEHEAEFVDLLTKTKHTGRYATKTSRNGEARAEYAVSPNMRFVVSIGAAGFLPKPKVDTLTIRGDSSIALVCEVTPQAVGPKFLTVFVRDRSGNPVTLITGKLVGSSGTEYEFKVDNAGKAKVDYDMKDGKNPRVELFADALGLERTLSPPKPRSIGSGLQLEVDINEFFPYDKTIQELMKQAQYFLKEEEWEKARGPLQQVIALRPGTGSAEAYVLLGKAWFDDDEDNYSQTLQALDKALADKESAARAGSESTLEALHYYRVRALYEAFDNLGSADPSRLAMRRSLVKACVDYRDLYKSPKFKSLHQRSKTFKNHLDHVNNVYGDVK